MRIYHNPRCSKSRAALALLQEAGIEPEIIDYLKTPLQHDEIASVIRKLDVPATALLRDQPALPPSDDEAVIKTLMDTPKLLQRPIIEDDTRAIIARPPARASEFISS